MKHQRLNVSVESGGARKACLLTIFETISKAFIGDGFKETHLEEKVLKDAVSQKPKPFANCYIQRCENPALEIIILKDGPTKHTLSL